MSPVSTVEDFEVEHKGSDSKLVKVEAEESYDDYEINKSGTLPNTIDEPGVQ